MNHEPDINPDDLADLAAAGEEVLRHKDRTYIIMNHLSGMDAVDFIETYQRATRNDADATNQMAGFIHAFAERLYEMMEVDDDEVDDYNAENGPSFPLED